MSFFGNTVPNKVVTVGVTNGTSTSGLTYAGDGIYTGDGVIYDDFSKFYSTPPTNYTIVKANDMARTDVNALYSYKIIAYNCAYSEKLLHDKRILLDVTGYAEMTPEQQGDPKKRIEMMHWKELAALKNIDDVVIVVNTKVIGLTRGKPE